MIESTLMNVTPEMAKEILKKNNNNRSLSRGRVAEYARQMKLGIWQTTHQGILIGKNGFLIDGQHRLSAVVQAGVTVQMLVSIDESIETPLGLQIDEGTLRRAHWVMGKKKNTWEVAKTIGVVTTGKFDKSLTLNVGLPRDLLVSVCDTIEPIITLLTTSPRTGFAVAPVRSAFVAHCLVSPRTKDLVIEQYGKLINADHIGMWPAVELFEKERIALLLKSERGARIAPLAVFARTYRSIEHGAAGRNVTRLQINDVDRAIEQIKEGLEIALAGVI